MPSLRAAPYLAVASWEGPGWPRLPCLCCEAEQVQGGVLSPLHAHVRQISMHSHTAPDHDRNPTPRGSTHTTAPDRVINPWRPGNPRRQVVPVAVVGEFDDVMARREVEVELSSGRDSLTSDQIGRKDKPAACCAFLHRVDAAAQSDHRTAGVQRPYSPRRYRRICAQRPPHNQDLTPRPKRSRRRRWSQPKRRCQKASNGTTGARCHTLSALNMPSWSRLFLPKIGRVGVLTHAACTAAPGPRMT